MKIKHSNSFNHFSKKFTFEFWLQVISLNGTIFTKNSFGIEIINGYFSCIFQGKSIVPSKINDYIIPFEKWNHVAITYKRKNGKVKIFLNCEEVVNFNIIISEEVGLTGEILIGNANLDAEITEIRIWNQEIPIKFIKENYKSPLPILAENKRKLRMKINKQEENKDVKKKFEFNKNTNGIKIKSN